MIAVVSDHFSKENRDFIRSLAILGTFFFVTAAIGYVATISWVDPIPRDGTTLVVGRDFLNYWMYGRAAGMPDPGRLYDLATYNGELAALLGPGYPGQTLPNPPSFMLLAWPLAYLSYMPALLCWTVFGAGIFAWVAARHIGDRRLLIALAFSPAAVLALISGQSTFLTAALLIGIFEWLDRKPIAAGLLIGLLTLKPQLGLLLPVMLVASGRWRVLLFATIPTLAIVASTAALYGPQIWVDYAFKAMPTVGLVFTDHALLSAPFMPTIFMTARLADASYGLAMAVQAVFAVLAMGAVFWAFRWRKAADPHLLTALFLACSVATSPYFASYDLLPLTLVALMLLGAGRLDEWGRRVVQLVYWLPLIQIGLGTLHVPGPGLIAPAFAIYVLTRLRGARAATLLTPVQIIEHQPG
jgi:glycosyl transferase family 87